MSYTKVFLKNEVRIYVSDLTNVAQEGIDLHETNPLPSLVFATGIAAFGPLGVMKKYGRIVSTMKGDGAIRTLIVESNANGEVRALVSHPGIVTEYDKDKYNTIPIQLGMGAVGTLKVINEVGVNSFGSEVKFAKGDIVTDLAWYFDQSEQIQSAVLTDVKLGEPQKLMRAYGVIFQLLPKANESDIKWVEKIVKDHKLSSFDSLNKWTEELEAQLLEEHKVVWRCSCDESKVLRAAHSMTPAEIEKLIYEQGKLEVTCSFCNKKFDLTNSWNKN